MPQMFKLMNAARISVGVQGVAVASTAFLNALEYTKDRKQGASITHWKDATAPRVPPPSGACCVLRGRAILRQGRPPTSRGRR